MKEKLLAKYLGLPLAVWIALAGIPAMALATLYVSGTVHGAVEQAIWVDSCNVDVGTCTVTGNGKSFTWNMNGDGGEVYQGSTYTANITLKNLGNRDIVVVPKVNDTTATGGNNQFEGTVTISPETLTVPAEGTAKFMVTVNVHPAEEPGEHYTIDIDVVPSTG